MNGKMMRILSLVALVVVVATLADAHKKFYNGGAPIYQEPGRERCVCECAGPQRPIQPVLPNKPYHGSAGYAQPPRQGGYGGNSGAYAVAESYGGGGSQVSGGY